MIILKLNPKGYTYNIKRPLKSLEIVLSLNEQTAYDS